MTTVIVRWSQLIKGRSTHNESSSKAPQIVYYQKLDSLESLGYIFVADMGLA